MACDFEKAGHFPLGASGGRAEAVHRIGKAEAEVRGGRERGVEEKRRITPEARPGAGGEAGGLVGLELGLKEPPHSFSETVGLQGPGTCRA